MKAIETEKTENQRTGLGTVPEVAQFLRMSRGKCYQMMDSGLLAYVKLGKSRRVPWEAVYRLVAENTIGG